MAQALLKAGEDGLLVAAFEIDDSVGFQPGLREGRCKQISAGDAPEHFPARAGGNSRDKEGRRGAVNRAVAATTHLMQRTMRKPAARKA